MGHVHKGTKGLEGGVSSLGVEDRNYGWGGEFQVRIFRFIPHIFGGDYFALY